MLLYLRPPGGLDSKATITIGDQTFEVDATDLEPITNLGRGAYGVVEKMRHRQSDTIMAVKVSHDHFSFPVTLYQSLAIKVIIN